MCSAQGGDPVFVPGLHTPHHRLQVVMAGPLSVANTIPWPPDGRSNQVDECNAAVIVEILHFGRDDWSRLEDETRQLLLRTRVAVKAVADRLLEVGAIPGSEVAMLVEDALEGPT